MISVIIPAYNAERTIAKCLTSLLKQTYKDYELIVVNDGSCDTTEKIVSSFENSKIKILNQSNKGVSSARNRGLREAKGEYICFVDADDYVDIEYLNQLANNIDDCDIVCGKCVEIENTTLKYLPGINVLLSVDELKSKLPQYIQKGYVCSPWMKLFKNSVIRKNNLMFNCNVRYGEDLLFVMNYLSCVNTVKLIDKPLYYYVRWENTSSTGFRRDIDVEYAKLAAEVQKFLGDKYLNQALRYQFNVMKDSLIMLFGYYKTGKLSKKEFLVKFDNISDNVATVGIKLESGLVDNVFLNALKHKYFALVKLMLFINSKLN